MFALIYIFGVHSFVYHSWGGCVEQTGISNSFNLPTGLHSDLLHPYKMVHTITTWSRPVAKTSSIQCNQVQCNCEWKQDPKARAWVPIQYRVTIT